jgi:ATP-dependent RNA helicase RhlE
MGIFLYNKKKSLTYKRFRLPSRRTKNSIVTFEELNLNKPLLNALSDLEYVYPTPIQAKAFPVIMSGSNVIGIAQTGTGKTFAYLLPILRQLAFSDQKDPRVLILAPTRELVIQILEEVKKLTKYANLRSAGVYGGTNINTQKQVIYNGIDILVATPGRLVDLAFTGVLRLKFIQKLVIDEVDEMLSLGFRTQLISLLDILPTKKQTLMFSATLKQEVEAFIAERVPYFQRIEIAPHGTPIEKIIQRGFRVPNYNTKVNLLELLLSTDAELSKVLVFVATKNLANKLYEHVEKVFPNQVGVIHSNKSHNTRLKALKQFEDGTHKVLIATDIIARGMDICDVTHVINFDIPEIPGDYIHRIGRTGRVDKDGVAISFISPAEQAYQHEIEYMMKWQISIEPLPEELIISKVFTEEEKPTNIFDRSYRKESPIKGSQGAFHEKKEKNKKVNLGGPKIRKERYDKTGRPRITKKNSKTRF